MRPPFMGEPTNSVVSVTIEKKSYKGLTGQWSKWGGRRYGIADNQEEMVVPYWYCQSCHDEQPQALSPFKWEYPEGEYIRVCASCYAEGCVRLIDRLFS